MSTFNNFSNRATEVVNAPENYAKRQVQAAKKRAVAVVKKAAVVAGLATVSVGLWMSTRGR
jgi:hypothetical protein